MKARVFRCWPITAPYRGEQTNRLTGGHDSNISGIILKKYNNAQKTAIFNKDIHFLYVKILFIG